jgi:DNA polymerase III alpha subunit
LFLAFLLDVSFSLPASGRAAHASHSTAGGGKSASQVLRERAEAGAIRLYGRITPEIQSRLDHEINVIARMGFEPIFLIVEDILNFARQTGVPYSSRGSAASSLVAHCLFFSKSRHTKKYK